MTKITAGPSHASRFTAVEPTAGRGEFTARASELIADLSSDNQDLLPAFHRIQHELGYVPDEAVPALASKFRTTPAMIYGALDFYSEIRTAPAAETEVEWCSGPACLLKGSMNIRRTFESIFGCDMNGRTEDGGLGLRLVQCDGTCHLAPLVRLNGRYIGPLSASDAVKLARELSGYEPAEPTDGAEEAAAAAPGGDEQV